MMIASDTDLVGAAVGALVFALVLGVLAGRLLAVSIGRGWTLLASLLGCTAGIFGGRQVDPDHPPMVALLALLFGVLATMLFVVGIEILVAPRHRPAGRGRIGLFLHPVRWVRVRLSPVSRTWEVLQFARRRGLARVQFLSAQAFNSPELGRRLRLTLEDAGGMFIKFGQIASTRSDLLGEALTAELAALRANVRPLPPEAVRPLLEAELDHPVEEVFASVEWEPLAAASIAQTHRAVTPDGRRVVLKLQRPGIDELLERDATVLRLVASIAERRLPAAKQLGFRGLCEEVVAGLEQELDFAREAAMSERLSLHTGPDVRVPEVDDRLSTPRLLVMEEATGRSVDRPEAMAHAGVAPAVLGRNLLRTFLVEVLQEGVYHADPHPGNVLVDEHGTLWLLDFGAVGVLDPGSRQSLEEIILGMTASDPLVVARAIRALADNAGAADLHQLQAEVGLIMVEAPGRGFDPRLLRRVLSVMQRHGMSVPRTVTQLSRALLTLDGTLQTISPGFDLQEESTKVVLELHAVESGDQGGDVLRSELIRALPMLRTLPEHADELATQLRAGRLSVRTERFADRDEVVVNRWVDRVLLAAVGIGGLIAASLLLLGSGQTTSHDVAEALRAVGFTGVVLSAILLLRTVAQVLQRERRSPPRPP